MQKSNLYRELHQDSDRYPGDSLRDEYINDISSLIRYSKSSSVLDYGCGKAGKHISGITSKQWNTKVHLYDPFVEQFSRLPTKPIDGVISTDVLEHVPEEEIDGVLRQVFGLANKFLFHSIAQYRAKTILSNGENAHCTVKPISWWERKLIPLNTQKLPMVIIYDGWWTYTRISYFMGDKNGIVVSKR